MDPQEQAPFSEVLGVGQAPAVAPVAPAAFATMTQPAAGQDVIQQMQKPVSGPEELQQRMAGWQKVLSDPNFMRAVGFMGAHLAQPRPIGQTNTGHLASAFNTGQTAFQAGEYAQYEQGMAAKKEARAQAESEANIASTQATTGLTTAKTPGEKARSDVAAATAGDEIAKAKSVREKAEFDLSKAKSVEEVDKLQRDLEKKKLEIEQGIPDATRRAAVTAELEAAGLKAKEARARITASEAAAGASNAAAERSKVGTAHEQITVDVLKAMPDAEKKQFLTKTGPYQAHLSSASATRDMYGSLYDAMSKSSPNDPRLKGKTREQFVLEGMTSQKSLDATTALKNYVTAMATANLDPDPDVLTSLGAVIKQGAQAKAGTGPGTGQTAGGVIRWVRRPDGTLGPEEATKK